MLAKETQWVKFIPFYETSLPPQKNKTKNKTTKKKDHEKGENLLKDEKNKIVVVFSPLSKEATTKINARELYIYIYINLWRTDCIVWFVG